jgi:hypothetical protein
MGPATAAAEREIKPRLAMQRTSHLLANLYFERVGGDFEVDLLLQTQTVECDPDAVPDLANRDPETREYYED